MNQIPAQLALRLQESGFPRPLSDFGIARRYEDITLGDLLKNFPDSFALRIERNGLIRGTPHWRALAVNITAQAMNQLEAIALTPEIAVAELAVLALSAAL